MAIAKINQSLINHHYKQHVSSYNDNNANVKKITCSITKGYNIPFNIGKKTITNAPSGRSSVPTVNLNSNPGVHSIKNDATGLPVSTGENSNKLFQNFSEPKTQSVSKDVELLKDDDQALNKINEQNHKKSALKKECATSSLIPKKNVKFEKDVMYSEGGFYRDLFNIALDELGDIEEIKSDLEYRTDFFYHHKRVVNRDELGLTKRRLAAKDKWSAPYIEHQKKTEAGDPDPNWENLYYNTTKNGEICHQSAKGKKELKDAPVTQYKSKVAPKNNIYKRELAEFKRKIGLKMDIKNFMLP